MCFSLSFLQINIDAAEKTDDIGKQFEELQNKITESMTLNESGYSFDEGYIRGLVCEFDIETFNAAYQTKWSKLRLADAMIHAIEEFKPDVTTINTPILCSSSHCKENRSISRWNYDRYYTDKEATKQWADKLLYDLQHGIFGDITLSVAAGYLHIGLGILVGIIQSGHASYQIGLSRALTDNNTTDCGVVTDINKFYAEYKVVNQKYFTGD